MTLGKLENRDTPCRVWCVCVNISTTRTYMYNIRVYISVCIYSPVYIRLFTQTYIDLHMHIFHDFFSIYVPSILLRTNHICVCVWSAQVYDNECELLIMVTLREGERPAESGRSIYLLNGVVGTWLFTTTRPRLLRASYIR